MLGLGPVAPVSSPTLNGTVMHGMKCIDRVKIVWFDRSACVVWIDSNDRVSIECMCCVLHACTRMCTTAPAAPPDFPERKPLHACTTSLTSLPDFTWGWGVGEGG